ARELLPSRRRAGEHGRGADAAGARRARAEHRAWRRPGLRAHGRVDRVLEARRARRPPAPRAAGGTRAAGRHRHRARGGVSRAARTRRRRLRARRRHAVDRDRLPGGHRASGACGAPPHRGPLAVTASRSAAVLAGNPRDGYLDRLVSRRLSPAVTRLLLPTPVTPNAVTFVGT